MALFGLIFSLMITYCFVQKLFEVATNRKCYKENFLQKDNFIAAIKKSFLKVHEIQYTSANSNTQGTSIFVRINECSN